MLFKMTANQIKCSKIEQKSVIEYLTVEKYKSCEVYRRICDVYGETYFSQKSFTNGLTRVWHYEPEWKRQSMKQILSVIRYGLKKKGKYEQN